MLQLGLNHTVARGDIERFAIHSQTFRRRNDTGSTPGTKPYFPGVPTTVLTTPAVRRDLREPLGVRAITGFREDVDWFESMAFELLLFDCLTHYKRLDAAEAYIKKNYGQLARRLGFVMERKRSASR